MIVAGQIIGLLLGGAGLLFGLAMVHWLLFPGGSGEWTGLAVPLSFIVDIPFGLASFTIGFFLKDSSLQLRRLCIASSLIALAFPFVIFTVRRITW